MLDGMRKAAQGPVGKYAMAAVMLLIIVGFVNWGVPGGGFFADFTSDKVATVGDQTVTAKEFENEFQNLIYRYQRQAKVPMTSAQAHAAGLDLQLLRRMIGEAALNARTHAMGLALSDETIAAAARSDPHLQDSTGQFSRAMFDQALRDSGLSERGFFAKQRQIYLRQQLEQALVDGLATPKPVLEALADAETQTRSIDYFLLPASAAGEIPAPTPETLKSYFEERKGSYKATEFRGIDILLVTPLSLARPGDVSDEDAKAAYEKLKDTKFTIPEKRKLQQMVFPTEAEASEAAAKIQAGATFDDIAKARNLTPTDLDLGEVAKADVFDHAIGDAAFALPEGGVSGVVKGQFGYLLVRVLSVTPGSVQPFADVVETVKKDLATQRASNDVLTMHDRIEDARVSGKSLVEAAKSVGLEAEAIPAVDASGLDREGKPVQLPEAKSLLRAVFASDIGVDDAPLNTKDRGYLWFDVTKVDPAHERPFDEVKDAVEKQWREEEVAKALSAKATDLVKQLDAGATLASLALAAGAEVKSASGIRRSGGAGLPESVVNAVFALTADKAGSASTPDGRLIFKITGDSTPPFEASSADAKSADEKLQVGFRNSLLDQYILALQNQLGVKINERVLQAAEGG
jgi:peptidyl-prolyl cis-trans isomerase D